MPQMQSVGFVWAGRGLELAEHLRPSTPHAPTVDGKVVHSASQVAFPITLNAPPGTHHPLQGRLQQVLTGCRSAREQRGRRQERLATLGDQIRESVVGVS